ncbi:carboxypeptidase-like regulatory domain-containing protein [Maribacter aurantiacus]|uniref:Carboxypeptidase-like regulatory domain-containing protein n=1 Tax=Maribacter aurantiacus TaxID=1882343 RepID=A0A5R8M9U7_9FLAO|nr:carboxypeptidase-like regulatory domain-containing protein [Maribacter aurantiacus]TLF46297.1 carboxypeptidase-like regulatory domain-containing protein [Maribacter aurantiacus]
MRVLFFAIAGLFTTLMYAQATGSVRGKILDSEMFNEPLLMASVSLKNTDWSDQTNFNGNFEITDVAPGEYIMEINFLGYESLEVPIKIKEDEQLEILESLKAKTLTIPVMAETSEKMTSDQSIEPNY